MEKQVSNAVKSFVNKIVSSIDHQEDPRNRRITECEIHKSEDGYTYEVWIRSSCDGWAEDVKRLFSYYPDELSFYSSEFIGMTEQYALDMYRRRDIAYLQRR